MKLIHFWILTFVFPTGVLLYKDIVFLVDKSSSLSQNDFNGAIDFIFNVTKFISVGSSAAQISVVTFSSDVTERFDLNDYTTNATLLTAISSLKSVTPSGSTYTYDALTFARTSSFITSKGSRTHADKTVIVLTDGQSINLVKTATEAQLLKDNLNAEVFSIGIGSAVSSSNAELLNISSDPDSYYSHHVTSYLDLCSLIPTVVPKLDPSAAYTSVSGCPVSSSSSSSTSDNTAVIASVGTVAGLAGLGLTALVATLLEKKIRGGPAKNQVGDITGHNQMRRETSRAIFNVNALNDPSAREVPLPDDVAGASSV